MSGPVVLLAEDEAPQRRALLQMLGDLWPEARVLACGDGVEALALCERERPNAALLDIRMPGRSGLQVAQAVSEHTHIVFVTAYEDHAIRAFEHGALDYLLKPVRPERLLQTVQRLKRRLAEPPAAMAGLLARLRAELETGARTDLKWLTASVGNTVRLYGIDEVLAFQAQDKYTRLVTASDEAILRRSLRDLLKGLSPDDFWQVHRSVVVRASAIDCVRPDGCGKYQLTLKGLDEVFPVSSAFRKRFRSM